jgi:hypothetical protein
MWPVYHGSPWRFQDLQAPPHDHEESGDSLPVSSKPARVQTILVLEDDVLVLYRCDAEGAACFCSQSAQLANAQAADVPDTAPQAVAFVSGCGRSSPN